MEQTANHFRLLTDSRIPQKHQKKQRIPPWSLRGIHISGLAEKTGDAFQHQQQRIHQPAAEREHSRYPEEEHSEHKHRKAEPCKRRHQQIGRNRPGGEEPLMKHRNGKAAQVSDQGSDHAYGEESDPPSPQRRHSLLRELPPCRHRIPDPREEIRAEEQKENTEERKLKSDIQRHGRIPEHQQQCGKGNRVQRFCPQEECAEDTPDGEHHKRPERRPCIPVESA